jgi:GTPase SAR1 family protein
MRAMSDDSKNFRRAKPVFMGLRRKLNGDIQNLIKDNEKKFAKQAEKTLTPFIVQRYNMYRDFTRVRDNPGESPPEYSYTPRIAQLLTQHVYGDYVLQDRARLMHRKNSLAGLTSGGSPFRPGLGMMSPPLVQDPLARLRGGLTSFEDMEEGLMGAGMDGDGQYIATPGGEGGIFEEIINTRAPESIFFLPSIGTAIMELAALTEAWPTALFQYFKGQRNKENSGRIPQLFHRILDNTDPEDDNRLGTESRPLLRAPWFEATEGANTMVQRLVDLAYDNPDVGQPLVDAEKSLFFITWAHSMLDSDVMTAELQRRLARAALQATFNATPDLMKTDVINRLGFEAAAGERATIPTNFTENGMNPTGATFDFLKSIEDLFSATAVSDVGKRVTLNQSRYFYQELFMGQEVAGMTPTEDNRFPWSSSNGYEGSPAFEDWAPYNGMYPDGFAYIVDSSPEDNPDDTGWVITNQVGDRYTVQYSGYALVNESEDPLDLEPTNIDLDTEQIYEIRGLQAQDFEIESDVDEDEEDVSSAIGSYNPTQIWFTRVMLDRYFEMESHLSLVLNSTKIDFRRYSKEYKEIDEAFSADADFYTTSAKKQKQVAEFLAEERASIMSGLTASFLALAGDGNYRKLYEQDLNLLEIKWYSDFISTRLLQARPVEEQVNQLRQRMAVPAPAATPDVLAMQVVQPTTVIRTLDVPTLRMIMKTYFQRFYNEIANIARELDRQPQKKNKKGKKQKKKPLFDQMWDTVEATIVTMLSLEKANPARYWQQTFSQVEQVRQNTQMILPPSWAGTVSRAELESDKFSIGLTPDIEKNILLFKNYVSFLRTTYRDNYVLIAGLLTAFQSTGSDSITDISELQDFFMQRLRNDESFQLRGRSVPAYRQFIYICRETLTIPSYVLAASLAMERNIEATRSPVESQGAELEGGIMMGPTPTPFQAPPPPPVDPYEGMRGNPSLLRPNRRTSE